MLPGRDGVDICRELRVFSEIPIVMVTAKVEEIDRRVRRLTAIRKTLAELASACRNGDANHECPIIEALTDPED